MPFSELKILDPPRLDTEIPWKIRLKIAFDISMGMAYLHSMVPPIVHRDLRLY